MVDVVFERRALEEFGVLSSRFNSTSSSSYCGTNREVMAVDSAMHESELDLGTFELRLNSRPGNKKKFPSWIDYARVLSVFTRKKYQVLE